MMYQVLNTNQQVQLCSFITSPIKEKGDVVILVGKGSAFLCARYLMNYWEDWIQLRNEFNFCKVHGIMNTSGLLQSKTLQETRSIHDLMNLPKI